MERQPFTVGFAQGGFVVSSKVLTANWTNLNYSKLRKKSPRERVCCTGGEALTPCKCKIFIIYIFILYPFHYILRTNRPAKYVSRLA